MFRCPTCIGVLADPTSSRCQMCGQRLRRRRPRVLGEEHRPGAKLLPIERALHARLHGTTHKSGSRAARHMAPVPWADQYRSTASATAQRIANSDSDLDYGGGVATLTPPADYRIEPQASTVMAPPPADIETGALDVEKYLSSFEPAGSNVIDDAAEARELLAPLAVGNDMLLDPPSDTAIAPAPVFDEFVFEIETGPLDPEVQALVDDLYRKAHAEVVGSYDGLETVPGLDTARFEQTVADDTVGDESLSTPRRRGWVPAVLGDRRRHDGTGTGKRPNGNGWRRLDD